MTIDLVTGLVLYLPFNEGSGTSARDGSMYGTTCALQNMDDSNWVAGKSGNALYFNGTNEYVDCSGNDSLKLSNALTMSAWVKLDDTSGWQTMIGHANGMYTLQTHNQELVFYYCDSGPTGCNRIMATSTIVTTEWTHVACIRQTDGTTLLYVNGVQDSTTGNWSQCTVDSDNWYVGASYWGEELAGKIDEVRLYNRALSPEEITWLYTHPTGAMTGVPSARSNIKTLDDGLVLYLPFNDGSGASARDDSGCGNTGALQNMSNMDWVTGKSGYAVEVNGINEYIDCGNDTSLQVTTQTISAWIKTAVDGTYIYGSRNDSVGGGNLWITGGKLQFILNSTQSASASTTVTDDVWHHVCVTFDDDTKAVKYFVDGNPDGTSTNAATFVHTVDKLVGFRVSGNAGHHFDGCIDELRVYNRVLTQTEITWLYKHPSGKLTDHPSGRACFTDLDGVGHTISDMISLEVSSELSDSADSFSLELSNIADRYSWLERGCEIEIGIGMDGINVQKLTGVVLDVERYIDGDDYPFISVSGEDWGYKLNHLFFSGRFYDLELSDLLKAIFDSADYSSSQTWQEIADISSDYSHIDPTAFSIDVASYKWKSLSAAAKEIADTAGYDWYVDVDKKVHLFDAGATTISATITESDLVAPPSLTDEGDIVNRAIVVGGYDQREDQEVAGQTSTTTVKSDVSANEKFTPTQDYLSSVMIWTKLISGSSSGLTLSVQADSGGSPDGVNLPHGKIAVSLDEINDEDYTEFRFDGHVTLTPGHDYHLVLYGTTTGSGEGQYIGTDGSNVVYITRWPSRVAILAEDIASQSMYGMTMCTPHTDNKLEDPDLVEQMANNMLMLSPKTVASLELHGTAIDSGDVVRLNLATPGIAVDKKMKVLFSSWSIGERFVNNSLELKEI